MVTIAIHTLDIFDHLKSEALASVILKTEHLLEKSQLN